MNDAAMKSYMSDISHNIDITSKSINDTLKKTNATVGYTPAVDPMLPPFNPDEEDDNFFGDNRNKNKRVTVGAVATTSSEAAATAKAESLWCEAVTDEGHTYYWNVKTNGNVII